MGFEFSKQRASKPVFWLSHRSLQDRLGLLLPNVSMSEVVVVSTDLRSNASFVNYVRHHLLTHAPSGTVLEVVEKSIRKIGFISSLEARFYREHEMLQDSLHFQHPPCYGLIETPWESLIFTQYVRGRAPRMLSIAAGVARGIAEIEGRSHEYLEASPRRQAFKYWQMDFFQPWYLIRSRFNFSRYLVYLRELAREDQNFVGLEPALRDFIPQLRAMARASRQTPRCFCHMDYLRKNLFVSKQGLQLIDWSEVKLGRVGFDGGADLSALFRRNGMEQYIAARDDFLEVYEDALDPRFDRTSTMNNVRYVFLLYSLWNCMRPKTIKEFRDAGKSELLREKMEYLLNLRNSAWLSD